MLRIFKDLFVPKYKAGKWTYDKDTRLFKFNAKQIGKAEPDTTLPTPFQVSDYKFKDCLNEVEETIMRRVFTRNSFSYDSDVITIQDIKNLVLFLAPSEILSAKFIDFVHEDAIDKMLNALIIYFEHFLKVVEYLLIERDQEGKQGPQQGNESLKVKIMFSEYLSQYRLLIAREYAKIVMGTHGLQRYHHFSAGCNISRTTTDRHFHEGFIAFCTQIVWIAHHRRAYRIIDSEMNRLFRSCHFNLTKTGPIAGEYLSFDRIEQQVLFGKNDMRRNFRQQTSPLIQEILNTSAANRPILWMGVRKYRGEDLRILQMERECVIPESQLTLIDVSHGILGHPKSFYNTLLALDWTVLRKMDYSLQYDPYKLFRSPYLEIPDWENFSKPKQHYDSHLELKNVRLEDEKDLTERQKSKWYKRDIIISRMRQTELPNDILLQCQKQIDAINDEVIIDRQTIIANFLASKKKLGRK